ncbi:hypothetical protein ACOSP7_004697 [Xanthoceras sorbifolium]
MLQQSTPKLPLMPPTIKALTQQAYEGLLGQVNKCRTALEVWEILERYAQHSMVRILQLKQQLQTIKKGSLSITDYIMRIKVVGDALEIAGHVVTDSDLVLSVINDLEHEYNSVLQQILLLILIEVEAKEEVISLGDKAEVEQEEKDEDGIIKSCIVNFAKSQAMQLFNATRDSIKIGMTMHLIIHLLMHLNIIRFRLEHPSQNMLHQALKTMHFNVNVTASFFFFFFVILASMESFTNYLSILTTSLSNSL